jgi:hypothetical protein
MEPPLGFEEAPEGFVTSLRLTGASSVGAFFLRQSKTGRNLSFMVASGLNRQYAAAVHVAGKHWVRPNLLQSGSRVSGKGSPNKRPGVDAGWHVLFEFQRHRPRATQAGRSVTLDDV